MAQIFVDIHSFAHQKSLVGFAGTDPIKDDSGDKVSDSKPSSKRGSPYLRRTLFVIMTILLQLQPPDDLVYQFLDKKRSEGKPYYVYMTAGMTKFLRIYYGKVRDCLKEKGLWSTRSILFDTGCLATPWPPGSTDSMMGQGCRRHGTAACP